MSGSELSEPLRRFVERYIPTVDHVAVLLAAREHPATAHSPSALAQRGRLDRSTADQVVTSLITSLTPASRPQWDVGTEGDALRRMYFGGVPRAMALHPIRRRPVSAASGRARGGRS